MNTCEKEPSITTLHHLIPSLQKTKLHMKIKTC